MVTTETLGEHKFDAVGVAADLVTPMFDTTTGLGAGHGSQTFLLHAMDGKAGNFRRLLRFCPILRG